jgi:hypothetical protein
MVNPAMKSIGKLIALFVLLGLGSARADRMSDVNVYSFLTPAGQKLAPPTGDQPAICLLVNGGYHENGAIVAGENPPSADKVQMLVQKALAAAHYLAFSPGNLPKSRELKLSYIIVYYWGYMNPTVQEADAGDDNDADASPTVDFNGPSMLSLVAGDSLNNMVPNSQAWNEALAAAEQNRYFVFIAAYSPAAYFKDDKREKKLLWRAQMSLPSDGVTLDQSIAALVASSVNYLGRPTELPKLVNMDLDRSADVIIGTPEVKAYLPPVDAAKPAGPPPDRSKGK